MPHFNYDKPVLADVQAIKSYGVGAWHEAFFWPVPYLKIRSLLEECESFWFGAIGKSSPEDGILMGIITYYLFELTQLLHALMVQQQVVEAGGRLVSQDEKLFFHHVIHDEYPLPDMIKGETSAGWADFGKTVKRFFCDNRPGKILMSPFRPDKNALAFGWPSGLMREYMETYPGLVIRKPFGPAGFSLADLKEGKRDQLTSLGQFLVKEIKRIFEKHGFHLTSNSEKYLSSRLVCELARADFLLTRARSFVQGKILLAPLFANSHAASLAVAMREKGGQVISSVHGGEVGMSQSPVWRRTNLMFSDEFITYSSASAKLFKLIERKFPSPFKYQTTFRPCASRQYRHMFHSRTPGSSAVRHVMVIGAAMNGYMYASKPEGDFDLMQLDLELRIIDSLKKGGYRVLYKAHPDRLVECKGLFENYADEIFTEDFSLCMDQADAYVFPAFGTTATSYALCTNKPIVMISPGPFDGFEPGALEVFERRVALLRTRMDERNRIALDEQALVQALERAKEKIDHEFVTRYLLDEKC